MANLSQHNTVLIFSLNLIKIHVQPPYLVVFDSGLEYSSRIMLQISIIQVQKMIQMFVAAAQCIKIKSILNLQIANEDLYPTIPYT